MNEHDETENLEAPPKLVEALRNVQKEKMFVPTQLDESILRHAREHLRPQQRKIVFLHPWAALAASIAIAAGLFAYLTQTEPQHFVAEDINRDGSLDILDAFALARRIEEGNGGENDFNRDGTVDKKDVESLALEAVRLSRNDLVGGTVIREFTGLKASNVIAWAERVGRAEAQVGQATKISSPVRATRFVPPLSLISTEPPLINRGGRS